MAITWDDAAKSLSRLTYLVCNASGTPYQRLIRPDERQRSVLNALDVPWPSKTPAKKIA